MCDSRKHNDQGVVLGGDRRHVCGAPAMIAGIHVGAGGDQAAGNGGGIVHPGRAHERGLSDGAWSVGIGAPGEKLPDDFLVAAGRRCAERAAEMVLKFRVTPGEIFPKVVDGRDSLSGELRSIFEDHSCDHLRQQRAAVEFSP
ncbi:MAG: hypothetical protein ABR924_15200, partial [Terracidiphilus sp.]